MLLVSLHNVSDQVQLRTLLCFCLYHRITPTCTTKSISCFHTAVRSVRITRCADLLWCVVWPVASVHCLLTDTMLLCSASACCQWATTWWQPADFLPAPPSPLNILSFSHFLFLCLHLFVVWQISFYLPTWECTEANRKGSNAVCI